MHKWTKQEVQYLRKNYKNHTIDELSSYLGLTFNQVKSKCKHLKLRKFSINDKSILLLKKYYSNKSLSDLIDITGLCQAQIIGYANRLGLSREYNSCDVSEILNKTNIGYYLLGLILSDGSIQNKQLKISLSEKDKNYLETICDILNININSITKNNGGGLAHINSKNKICNACGTSKDILKMCEIFDIKSNKTYNPPNVSIIPTNQDKLYSFLAGLIDGDGSISIYNKKYHYMKIEIVFHKNWNKFYKQIIENLKDLNPKLNKHMKATNRLVFYNKDSCLLSNRLIQLNLPLMDRKWSKFR